MTVATDTPSSPEPGNHKKKGSMGALLVKVFLGLVALLIIIVAVIFFTLNYWVKLGVVDGGEYATKQQTALASADLSLSGGTLQLSNLGISNLKGYSSPDVLTMKSCATAVDTGSLFSHTVLVKSIWIDGLQIYIDQNGINNNLNELMKAIQQNTAATGSAPTADGQAAPASNTPPGKELKIGVLKLTNTVVHIHMAGTVAFNQDFTLPDLEMDDPTNPDGRPMKIADLVGKILLQVGKEILENPQIPGDLKANMKNVTSLVNGLQGQLQQGLKNLNVGDLGKNLGGLQNAGKNLQDAGKNIGNLLNNNKNK